MFYMSMFFKRKIAYKVSVFFLALIAVSCSVKEGDVSEVEANVKSQSRVVDFNFDWNFYLTQDSLQVNELTDVAWRKVNLPHDWVVEGEFDSILSVNNTAWSTGYLPSKGYGFYKKNFDLVYQENKVSYIHFDGVYNNSEVWLNGNKLGFHPYGYSPFCYDITPYLNKDGKNNEVVVRIDHSRFADSRWYTGAGIYRNVELITTDKLHIPVWGVFVTTPSVTKESATVDLKIDLENGYENNGEVVVKTAIYDDNNLKVGVDTSDVAIAASSKKTINQKIEISNPKLWGIETPNLYSVVVSVEKNGEVIDTYNTRIGVRTFKFDTNTGFFLNGENMKIKGVCLHHDGGLVGAAVPKGVWKRKLQTLKEGGTNAIRISHNPASSEFLDLCDEMGFLVQDEFFDEWDNPKDKRYNQNESRSTDYITRGYNEHFHEWAHKDLTNIVLSHRNHPSIFQWSIGNEIEWTYPRNADATGFFGNMEWSGNYFWDLPPYSPAQIKEKLETLPRGKYDIGKTANMLSDWTKALDTTRPITANMILPSASHLSGYADALDVVGYSYRRILYDYGHENYPDKPIMGNENLAQYHEWKAIMERPFISGTFLWTGVDYMGEIRSPWPTRVQPSGMLNSAGFEKGSYHMMKTLWSNEPHIHIATQTIAKSLNKIDESGNIVAKNPEAWKHALWEWQDVNDYWNYEDGEMVSVEIYSNCDEIELFLNNKSLGKKKLVDFEDHIYKWGVPYAKGKLVAKGVKGDEVVEEYVVTDSKAVAIETQVDNKTLKANGYDVAHLVVQLKDINNNPVKLDDREVTLSIEGPVKLLGVDNGWKNSVQKFQTNVNTTFNGRTMFIIQSTLEKGEARLKITGQNLQESVVNISIN